VTAEFLEHQRSIGNDLSTPMPHYRFPDWLRTHREGCAARVVLASTDERTLDVVSLEVLGEHAVDVPDDLGNLQGGRRHEDAQRRVPRGVAGHRR
jgi:hypothetical protein